MNKLIIYLIAFSITLFRLISHSNAQSITTGFEAGVGSSYIVENYQSGSASDFYTSITTGVNFKLTPIDSYFGIRLNLLYVNTLFNTQYNSTHFYSGEVSTITTSLLLEHLNETKKFNLGYNFGLGVTREEFSTSRNLVSESDIRNYMSVTLSGILSYRITEKSFITLTPVVFWTDPINSFRTYNYYNAREDISALIQLGFTYKLK